MVLNKYPTWKNVAIIVVFLLGIFYALPNLYGEDPAVQISGVGEHQVDASLQTKVERLLHDAQLPVKSVLLQPNDILIRVNDTEVQLKAKELLENKLGHGYSVALNLASASPAWLSSLGASPMRLGLDLRGGVHFALDVDISSIIVQRLEGAINGMASNLREENIRYADITLKNKSVIYLQFRDADTQSAALNYLRKRYPDFALNRVNENGAFNITATLSPQAINDLRQHAIEQTMTTLRNRVNELGVTEAMVQQQGLERIAVDLPGIQDTARAKEILGGTATLEFRMVDSEHDPNMAANGYVPPGSKLYVDDGRPLLLKNHIILTGNSITDASSGFDQNGKPAVNISLGGGGESYFHRITAENVGKLMAIVYVETKSETKKDNNKIYKVSHKDEHIISVATIKSALPNNFQITNMRSPKEARDLALMLRAGALPAAIEFVEERTVGPSLGLENIHLGIKSVLIGMSIIIVFMAFYYRLFGLIADIALLANLILLVALLSILGATLTLPGIAGIVLTVGMAVDANVLIFERIREELRQGLSIQSSIHAGYERAFATIFDANVTTLIVTCVLFGIGTGPIKGFAVTTILGLLTSMLTAIVFTRAIVNKVYGGGRHTKKLSIGI